MLGRLPECQDARHLATSKRFVHATFWLWMLTRLHVGKTTRGYFKFAARDSLMMLAHRL